MQLSYEIQDYIGVDLNITLMIKKKYVSELRLNMYIVRSKGLAPGKLAKRSECHAIGASQSVTLIMRIKYK